ncbi:MAG: MFS transporter [Candidatus Pacebacteria bacterium]|nr:MFS transporter [Candidatus Paceibacterota bacterium]
MLRSNKNILIISLITLISMLGYGLIIPVLYSYTQKFGLSDFQNGLLFATFSICQFIAAPIIGKMSDRFGRKPLLITSIAGTTVSFFLMAFAPNAAILFIARALDGITAGSYSVAAAVIADSAEGHERTKGFSMFSAANEFGFILGPVIAALTVGIHMNTPFIVAGTMSLIALIVTMIHLPETNKHIGKETEQTKLFDFKKIFSAIFDKKIGTVLTIIFFFAISFSMMMFTFQPFCLKILKLQPSQISWLFTLLGTAGIITQLFLIPNLKAISIKKLYSISLLITSLSMLFIFKVESMVWFIFAVAILGLASSATEPLLQTLLSRGVDEKSQGSVMGLASSYGSIGRIIGPISGGAIASIAIPFPFFISGLILMFCFVLSFKVYEKIETN